MVFGTILTLRRAMRVVSPLCVSTHMYLAYKIAHNAGIMMPGKCTSARALEFVPKILYLHPFVCPRGLKWPVGGERGPHKYTSRCIFIRLQRATNVTCIHLRNRPRWGERRDIIEKEVRHVAYYYYVPLEFSLDERDGERSSNKFLPFSEADLESIILHAWYSNFRGEGGGGEFTGAPRANRNHGSVIFFIGRSTFLMEKHDPLLRYYKSILRRLEGAWLYVKARSNFFNLD